MMEGAFYERKKTSPTALAIVVLMHGAGITALALTKTDVADRIWPGRTDVIFVPEPEVPPETPPEPRPQTQTPRTTESRIDRPTPIEPIPLGPVIAGPVGPPPMPFPQGPVVEDPPAPLPQPPIEKARTVEPARAKANLASYVSDQDYPSNAIRNGEQGTTRFRLAVGPDGKVKECTVTSSSGSSALDSTTCKLMRQRAKFTPARNNRGEPTVDTVASGIKWVLPTD
ncbi:MAG TPA: TonB family protein [Allosphingosinicella sp.]|jgi:protein TonB|nr:TonB family protein [Allosphingosinicella sp.]